MASSAGFTLGGSLSANGVDEMRAARLARFGRANSPPIVPPVGASAQAPAPAMPALTAAPAATPAALPAPVPAHTSLHLQGQKHLCKEADGAAPDVSTPPVNNGERVVAASAKSGFASMPEGALLRIAAHVDLPSGLALTAVFSGADEPTSSALVALRSAMGRAQDEHRAAQEAVEAERMERVQRRNGEQEAAAAALAALAPMRTGTLQFRNPMMGDQFAQVVQMLEQGAEPHLISPEVEAELAARLEAAAGLMSVREAQARAHIAEGELQAAASWVQA